MENNKVDLRPPLKGKQPKQTAVSFNRDNIKRPSAVLELVNQLKYVNFNCYKKRKRKKSSL